MRTRHDLTDAGAGLAPLLMLLLLIAPSMLGAEGGCGGGVDPSQVEERCTNGADDNEDGLTDCADPQCALHPSCRSAGAEHCFNGVDDDGDGAIDCADPKCDGRFICESNGEDCVNGRDDDFDGDIDCADDACANTAACAPGAEDCTNGIDDDGDEATDCDDADCQSVAVCLNLAENCTNGLDDDGDGAADCDDDDCARTDSCVDQAENCLNGADDDGDGAIDCADADCANTAACLPLAEECDNGLDDDGDGFVDCDDTQCAGNPSCAIEFCFNISDDDGDGLDDCEDPDCEGISLAECLGRAESCTNGLDDDGDEATDCDDSECVGHPFCTEDAETRDSCQDMQDNDLDGQIDCADDGCAEAPSCQEVCDDGIDNDFDGDFDCADDDCLGADSCLEQNFCEDGDDNDLDGDTDCADDDCLEDSACQEICDGQDNDLDGVTDEGCDCLVGGSDQGVCADGVINPDGECNSSGYADAEICEDALDNDCDGVVNGGCSCDYAGSDQGVCAGAIIGDDGLCAEPAGYSAEGEVCGDGLDNDCNGGVDDGCPCDYTGSVQGVCASGGALALDGTCSIAPPDYALAEDCEDALDNDCDGVVNGGCSCDYTGSEQGVCAGAIIGDDGLCAEPAGYSAEGEVCGDGLDNDCNGGVDDGCPCDYTGSVQGVCASGGALALDGTCSIAPPDYDLTEDCEDALDNDCDGGVNEGCSCDFGNDQGVCADPGELDLSGTCQAPTGWSADEICGDGLDNDCDGGTDNGCLCDYTGSVQGVCDDGGRTDDDGTCSIPPADYNEEGETCGDGLDNDCDGSAEEGCPCDYNNSTQGVCAGGGAIDEAGACSIAPADYDVEESCEDAVDNDCDGGVNEGCTCDFGGTGQGVCADGALDLSGTCQAPPEYDSAEVCGDGLDNDCNGSAEEGCSCDYNGSDQGVCAAAVIDTTGECAAPAEYATDEICGDGLDNDCDGVEDDGCPCDYLGSDQGVCAGGGAIDSSGCGIAPEDYATDELCGDGLDNDCDGGVDEGCSCDFGNDQGACAEPGALDTTGTCQPPAEYADDELCGDGVDNDCDGDLEEGCPCDYAGSDRGVCADAIRDDAGVCLEPTGYNISELCGDGLDNDCNGGADDGCPCTPPAGPVGVCAEAQLDISGACIAEDFEATEVSCGDGLDNDCDGVADCDDPDCVGAPPLCDVTVEICTNMVDNDGDGQIACGDIDCRGPFAPPNCQLERCGPGGSIEPLSLTTQVTSTNQSGNFTQIGPSDANGNGLYGNADPDCFTRSPYWTIRHPQEVCGDGLDNDTDSFIDCMDLDCADHPSCTGLEQCDNKIDDDSDGDIDCADADCQFDYKCARDSSQPGGAEIYCSDGVDDDGDGDIDCADVDCGRDPACHVELCNDGVDNDGDGLADLHDPECDGRTRFGEVCDDDRLNHTDPYSTYVDCYQSDCQFNSPTCQPERRCDDGLDENYNGLTDCDDPDCFGDPACPSTPPEPDTELCDTPGDDDSDGLINCADPDCAGSYEQCHLELCGDGIDNNSNEATDCDDIQCVDDPFCTIAEQCTLQGAPPTEDRNGNGAIGCGDLACQGADNCQEEGEGDCFDYVDANGNGLTGCEEPSCREIFAATGQTCPGTYPPLTREQGVDCQDGVDNDGDLYVDCADYDCREEGHCTGVEICDDGVDNDLDGDIDCADTTCLDEYTCEESMCTDGADDNGNGYVDCQDIGCINSFDCAEQLCDDGTDDDGDGPIDCDDPDCSAAPTCSEGRCEDGLDNDGDGDVDCDDLDCAYTRACAEIDCRDGVDDEGDGLIDCADDQCLYSSACGETQCDDGVDNDGDGFPDCDDSECAGTLTCTGDP